MIWVSALLASILPLDRLIEPDVERGLFDQWALRGISEEWVIAVRVLSHWISFGPPLMLATVPAAAMLGLSGGQMRTVELGLLAGTPGLAALGVSVAAITAGLRGGAALADRANAQKAPNSHRPGWRENVNFTKTNKLNNYSPARYSGPRQ